MGRGTRRLLTALLLALLLTGTALASSAATARTILANYPGVKIVLDGEELALADANGVPVEPFISDGTTYLPVRAIASALGLEVLWDATSNTIYLGRVPDRGNNWMVRLPPAQVNRESAVYDGSSGSFRVSGRRHTVGMTLTDPHGWLEAHGADYYGYALWNTGGWYSSMTLTIGHMEGEVDEKLVVYLDGEPSGEYLLDWDGEDRTITIPLDYASTVRLVLDGPESRSPGVSATYGVYDISFAE